MELNSEQIETQTKTQNNTQIEMSTEMEKENPWKVVTTLKRRPRLFQDANLEVQQINKVQRNSDSSQQKNENFVDSIPDLLFKTPEKGSPLNSERNNEVDKKVNKKRELEKVENHHNEK